MPDLRMTGLAFNGMELYGLNSQEEKIFNFNFENSQWEYNNDSSFDGAIETLSSQQGKAAGIHIEDQVIWISATNDYPTDLDESEGHTSATQHNADGEYHYHIQNETYLNEYYILFPGDYQGTPNSIQ